MANNSPYTPGTGESFTTKQLSADNSKVLTVEPSFITGSAGAHTAVPFPGDAANGQDVDVTRLPQLTAMSAASSTPTGVVSLGNSLGKVLKNSTGTLASTAVTADQVILTYTVTAAKTFYLQFADVAVRLTTYATTATNFGTASLQIAGVTQWTVMLAHAGVVFPPALWTFDEGQPVAAGTVIRWVCTPAATTAFTWRANFGGYEK